MNYKISTYALVILLLATVYYYNNRPEKQATFIDNKGNAIVIDEKFKEDISSYLELMSLDEKFVQKLKSATIDSTETGIFQTRDEAKSKLESFKEWNKKFLRKKLKITPYGFAFGLNKMRRLLAAIDLENKTNQNDPDNIIHGIRINLSKTFSYEDKETYLDAMIVPIMKNGKNYINITDDKVGILPPSDDLLLNTSAPCPDMCN